MGPKQRYNGIRPPTNPNRIDMYEYPDPTNFHWEFTGSCSEAYVEFFEKDFNMGTVRLDFYYTTGTIKTVLHHSSTGINQLFRDTVSPDIYLKILQNPRAHTDQGYRLRKQKVRVEEECTDTVMNEEETIVVVLDNANDQNSLEVIKKKDGDVEKNTKENESDNDIDIDKDNDNDNVIDNDNDMVDVGNNDVTKRITPEQQPYYAKNDQYDFKTDGHLNRKNEMSNLQSTRAFKTWEEATKIDCACVHAKFYVSVASRKGGGRGRGRGRGRGHGRGRGRGHGRGHE